MSINDLVAWATAVGASPRALRLVNETLPRNSHLREATMGMRDAALRFGLAPRWKAGERASEWLRKPSRHVVHVADPSYPNRLRQGHTPPAILYVEGELKTLKSPQFAIVGSRKASSSGKRFAWEIAKQLGARGLAVTSGLALGIDSAAHRGALAAGAASIAVLGCGLDRVYPPQNEELAQELRLHGALVSEFPLGSAPLRHHFPQRNRIIAGLALGTLVVEAAARSGSISTALHALEYGRDVFAVPGSVGNPLSRGCHALIKQGAKLTESLNDILEEFTDWTAHCNADNSRLGSASGGSRAGIESADSVPRPERVMPERLEQREGGTAMKADLRGRDGNETDATRLLADCGWETFTIDQAAQRSGLTVSRVSSILLRLELDGYVDARGDGTYIRQR